jgi:anti-sigma factor RsiW
MCPESVEMVAYSDGELSERRRRRICEHLTVCGSCRSDLDALESEKVLLAAAAPAAPGAGQRGLDRVLAGVARLKASQQAERERRRRTLQQLTTYFGAVAAGLVGEIEQDGLHGPGLEAAAEPLFSAFLGRRAAASVMSRIRHGLELEAAR